MFGWFKGRRLEDVINPTRVVYVHGVKFSIRKLNPIDYLTGSKGISQVFDTFQSAATLENVEIRQSQVRDIQSHYAGVFLSAVVDPPLKASKDKPGEGTPVEYLMTDWDFANELYSKILEYTYGKKKLASLISSKTAA